MDFNEYLARVKQAEAAQHSQSSASTLSAVLRIDGDKESSLGTVASPQVQVHRAAAPRLADRLAEKQAKTFCPTAVVKGQERKASGGNPTEGCIKGESAAAVPPDALQGIPLSDQEREDIAAGLTPAQAERVAKFRRMDAALISARSMKKPYLDSLGIPQGFRLTASRNTGTGKAVSRSLTRFFN